MVGKTFLELQGKTVLQLSWGKKTEEDEDLFKKNAGRPEIQE